jgi:hypothetical protein
MLLDIAHSFIAADFFLVAIGLLRMRLSPAARALFRVGKRISG